MPRARVERRLARLEMMVREADRGADLAGLGLLTADERREFRIVLEVARDRGRFDRRGFPGAR